MNEDFSPRLRKWQEKEYFIPLRLRKCVFVDVVGVDGGYRAGDQYDGIINLYQS